MFWTIGAVTACIAILVAARIGGSRYEKRQRRLGKWDEYGPLVESKGPPHGMRGNDMNERLEITGKWQPEIVRRRRPHEHP
jgi:hypothetical protein